MANKWAVVTGAGRGIGASIALELAKQNYGLILISRTLEQLKETQKNVLKEVNVPLELLALDLSDQKSFLVISALIEKLIKQNDIWEVLVNNAGVCYQDEIKNMSDESFEKMLAVNVTAVFKLCRLALQKMSPEGTLVNVASVAGIYGVSKFDGLGPYAATKAAVIGLTEMIAQEGNLHGKNILGYCISPGAVDTQMLKAIVSADFKADLKPKDIAEKVIQLVTKRPLDLNGKNIPVWSNKNE